MLNLREGLGSTQPSDSLPFGTLPGGESDIPLLTHQLMHPRENLPLCQRSPQAILRLYEPL